MPYAENYRRPSILPNLMELYLAGPEGATWYEDATLTIERYSETQGLNPAIVCDVLGLTSPRQTVARNVQLAKNYLQRQVLDGCLPSVKIGVARWSASLEHYHAIKTEKRGCMGVINGDKTRNFAHALNGDTNAVVIDVWMFRALKLDFPSMTSKRYRYAADLVRSFAEKVGDTPRNTQARIWVGTRKAYGYKGHAPLEM